MVQGGFREGAGRKTVFPGKTERITISLTPDALEKARQIVAALSKRHPDIKISVSDAFQAAVTAYSLPRKRKA